jgi:hypothetical protein
MIGRGLKDLAEPGSLSGEVRRPGGGGPTPIDKDPTLLENLRRLVEPATMGDPMRPLIWVSKSHAKLAAALREMGHKIADSSVPKMQGLLKYRRQERAVRTYQRRGDRHPGGWSTGDFLDTKKKELVGPFKNGGSDYRQEGCPDKVNVHDFVDKDLGRVAPYGVHDVAANTGYVNVGSDNDTAQFAVHSIRRWLDVMGRDRYPDMNQLMITADGGGSNG